MQLRSLGPNPITEIRVICEALFNYQGRRVLVCRIFQGDSKSGLGHGCNSRVYHVHLICCVIHILQHCVWSVSSHDVFCTNHFGVSGRRTWEIEHIFGKRAIFCFFLSSSIIQTMQWDNDTAECINLYGNIVLNIILCEIMLSDRERTMITCSIFFIGMLITALESNIHIISVELYERLNKYIYFYHLLLMEESIFTAIMWQLITTN